jgi:predicted nucleic acid-binding Zn ribbon protein
VPDDADRSRLAREALARAKADALARGNRPARPARPGAVRPDADPAGAGSGGAPGGRSAGGPRDGSGGRTRLRRSDRGRARRDDPQPLNSAIEGLLDAQGWREAAAVGSVFGRWAEIVGRDLAAHTRPDSLTDGELTVTADSTAWATQLRLLAAQLVRRLNAELGDGAVRQVRVRGPAAAAGPRRPGQWRARGGRGPRDTYG